MNIKSLLATLVLSLSLAAPVLAGPIEDGLAAYDRGEYPMALLLWRPLAERGNAKAQTNLGSLYETGLGVPQDYAKAIAWYRKAAEQGNDGGQFNLGVMYDRGKGVPQDYAKAIAWFREAAEQGYAKAQHNLGVMHDIGRGVPQDYAQAATWYRKAAEQGIARAQFSLSTMYANGQGVQQDYVEAYKWVTLAVARGYKGALKAEGFIARKMTPAQIAEAQRLAREWKPKQGSEKKPTQKPMLARPADKPVTVLIPRWSRLKTLPAARQDKTPLKPNDVFRLVNPSVWVVYAAHSVEELRSRKGKILQGSAVAISTSRLVTNCHIVSKRPAVIIIRLFAKRSF